MWVKPVGVGLRKRSRINKEPFITPFAVGSGSGKSRALPYDTLAGSSSFQSTVTCAVPDGAPPGF